MFALTYSYNIEALQQHLHRHVILTITVRAVRIRVGTTGTTADTAGTQLSRSVKSIWNCGKSLPSLISELASISVLSTLGTTGAWQLIGREVSRHVLQHAFFVVCCTGTVHHMSYRVTNISCLLTGWLEFWGLSERLQKFVGYRLVDGPLYLMTCCCFLWHVGKVHHCGLTVAYYWVTEFYGLSVKDCGNLCVIDLLMGPLVS